MNVKAHSGCSKLSACAGKLKAIKIYTVVLLEVEIG